MVLRLVLPFLLVWPMVGGAQTNQANFFLPQNPVAAAYVLGRLSDQELIAAPRSEFVYVALLQRKGLDSKYRLEALSGLAAIRHTSELTEALRAITELDKKGPQSEDSLRQLAPILLHYSSKDLSAKRAELEELALASKVDLSRHIGWAARVCAQGGAEAIWSEVEGKPAVQQDLLFALPLVPNPDLREQFYPKVKQLLEAGDPAELVNAAAVAIVTVPSHQAEAFAILARLFQAGVHPEIALAGLAALPATAWPKDSLVSLSEKLVQYLQKVPPEQRSESSFANALQFANEVASRLPPDLAKSCARTLRGLGPTVITLHAIYEQMRFDRERLVVEAGKPLVLFLQNDDAMPHNLAVLTPGALQEIGLAAEKMPPEPDSEGRLYVPASPKVLHATRLVSPGQKGRLVFTAPGEPGDYPFVCTFPGHWLRMSGTLTVVADVEAYLTVHPVSTEPKLTEWKLSDFASDLSQPAQIGNAAAGKELFSKLACVQCHKIGALGYAYGPDLTDVFKRYHNDRVAILEQILEPSKKIEDRYRNFDFELAGGDSLVGMILKEDAQTVTIQTGPADSLLQVLQKSTVQQRRPLTSSPMPVGLLNSLSKGQILDLLAYLESGGAIAPHHH